MRITFVLCGRGLAGGNRVIATYANGLVDRGHDVTIAYWHRPAPRHPLRRLRSFVERRRRTAGRDHLDDFRGRILEVREDTLARHLPDADRVLATHWSTAKAVRDLPPAKGEKLYFIQHYEAHTGDAEAVDETWRMPLAKIVISRWLQDLSRDRFGDDSAILVPNGIDLDLFQAPERPMNRVPRVGFLFSHKAWKGPGMAIEVVRRLEASGRPFEFVSFGDVAPSLARSLPASIECLERPPQVRIVATYASCDAWLCTSTTEGFGLPPLEAMACRCPAVSTRCGGPEDFVRDGRNGFLVELGDAAGMVERVTELTADASRWKACSDAAFETAAQYDLGRAVERFERAVVRAEADAGAREATALADPRR